MPFPTGLGIRGTGNCHAKASNDDDATAFDSMPTDPAVRSR